MVNKYEIIRSRNMKKSNTSTWKDILYDLTLMINDEVDEGTLGKDIILRTKKFEYSKYTTIVCFFGV